MNKKATGMPELLAAIIIVLLVIGIAIYFAKSSSDQGRSLSNFTACGNTGVTDGRCVATKAECNSLGGQFWNGLGCKGDKPYCCTGGDAGVTSTGCSWDPDNWAKCDECKVGMDKVELVVGKESTTSLKFGNKPYIRCYADQVGADCFKATVTGDGGSVSCTQDKNGDLAIRRDDAYESFLCGELSDRGAYTATCEIDTSKCCVAPGREKATLAFSYGN